MAKNTKVDKYLIKLGFKKNKDKSLITTYRLRKGIYIINVLLLEKTFSVTVGTYPFEVFVIDNLDLNDEDFVLKVLKSTHIIQNIKKKPSFFSAKRLL